MINGIIEFSCRNKFLVLFITVFVTILGYVSMRRVPLDAIPDLSDTQVIVYSRWDRSPDIVEDQVTYPLVTSLLGAPRVKSVRGVSDFGASYVYVIFEDGTDIYWARARTMEYLASVISRLPSGVKTELGPDASGLGWVYQYALVDESGDHSIADIRSYQDWYLRYHLKSVPGVADVAPIGGYVRQYQVSLDPQRLQAYGLTVKQVTEAVRGGNHETGGRLIEIGGAEFMVRGRGYARSIADFENIVVSRPAEGVPVRVKDLGQVVFGPELRRGVGDLDGRGDAVSGIVIVRMGENALDVINRVKSKIAQIEPGLPPGIRIVPVYDRSELIRNSIDTLRFGILEIVITVSLVILIFLWHPPSALVPIVTIPTAVLVSFIPFRMAGLTANIMSLGGIAIAIGALVDASIVVVEQVHKKLELSPPDADKRQLIVEAIKEVGAPSFFALLVIAVSFLPILALEAQEGRLFHPLALTKAVAMVAGAILAITLDPALRLILTRFREFEFEPAWLARVANKLLLGKIQPESKHPVSRGLIRLYGPAARWVLENPLLVIGLSAALVAATLPVYFRLGTELMPSLEEGSILYMPSSISGISATEAQKVLRLTDGILKQFPEVARVYGKAGRADTPTDPAPLSMLETVVTLHPAAKWRRRPTWYSDWAPEWSKGMLRHITSDHISEAELVAEMNAALHVPGLANGWTMPVRGRIDMLTTGIRTPLGLKVTGPDLATIEQIGIKIESELRGKPGARSVFAERSAAGNFLDIEWNREAMAHYGLTVVEAQEIVQQAIGGETVTNTVEGRERYPVSVRYQSDFRQDTGALGRLLVSDATGTLQVPLSELASISLSTGPAMVRNEDGMLTGYVYIDLDGIDPTRFIEANGRVLREKVMLPPGYAVTWSGQYEAISRVQERLRLILPLTLAIVFLLIYCNTMSVPKTMIVLLAVPFSAVGAIWLVYLLGYNLSVAVWVGLIGLLGVDAETGVFMLLYMDLAYEQAKRQGRMRSLSELQDAILQGAVTRLRPKVMTVAAMAVGLVPILWSTGTGADVMKRIAAPMVGGIFTSFVLELLVYPPIFQVWKWHSEVKPTLQEGQG